MPLVFCLFFFLVLNISATMAETEIISHTGSRTDDNNFQPQMTPDGRYIVYASIADDLVENDDNGYDDIFLYDSQTKITQRISTAVTSLNRGGNSSYPSISDDGRYIVYQSLARNLTTDTFPNSLVNENNSSTYSYYHIYLYDRLLNTTRLASKNEHNGNSRYGNFSPKISGNGQFIVYLHQDDEYWISGNPSTESLHLLEIEKQHHTELETNACHQKSGKISFPEISYNGEFIVFTKGNEQPSEKLFGQSLPNSSQADICLFTASMGNSTSIYRQDPQNTTNKQGIGEIYRDDIFSSHPGISPDGRYIVYETYHSDLSYGTDSLFGSIELAAVYLYDSQTKSRKLIYQEENNLYWLYDSLGWIGIYTPVFSAFISGNNQFVLFTGANPIDISDNNQQADTLLYSIENQTTRRVNFNQEGAPYNAINVAAGIGYDDSVIIGITPDIVSAGNYYQYNIFLTNNQIRNNFPLVWPYSAQTNDQVSIQLQATPPGYQQYLGLQMPNSDIFLFGQNAELTPFDSQNIAQQLVQTQETFQFQIDENFPTGQYQILSLMVSDEENSSEKFDALVKTQFSINEYHHFPSKTQVFGEDKCTPTFTDFVSYAISYDKNHNRVLFLSREDINHVKDNNNASDLFICILNSGQTQLVSLDEQGNQFLGGIGYTNSLLSDDGKFLLFQHANQYYLRNIDLEKTSPFAFPNQQDCYLSNFTISHTGSLVFFTCYDSSDKLTKAYLWKTKSNEVVEINKSFVDNDLISRVSSVFISESENLVGFSASIKERIKTDVFLYNIASDELEINKINFSNVNASAHDIIPTTNNVNRIIAISENENTVLLRYGKKNSTFDSPSDYYYAMYNRTNEQTQLLKLPGQGNYLKTDHTAQLSMNSDGRFFLFQSYQELPTYNNKILFGHSPFIYLYDRETEQLEQIQVQGIYNEEMKISADGRSFRLGDSIYPLTRRTILSSDSATKGDTLKIQFSDLPKGYTQYIGIENSHQEITEYNSANDSLIFNGHNFFPWQGDNFELEISINNDYPTGKYRVYLLTLPETIDPDINRDQWQLGISVFEVK